ncbi:MAG: host specificity factor TipJ family phage tail protein, partial [Veillonellales bacterium]
MITVIFVRNPFDPSKREKQEHKYIAAKTVYAYIESYFTAWPGTEFVVHINEHKLEDKELRVICPADGEQIVICPVVGKGLGDIFKAALSIALTGWLANTAATLAKGQSFFAKALITGGAMLIGGRIVSALLPAPKANNWDSNTSSTYSWDGPTNVTKPGTPIGKTFGLVKPAPVLLSRHVTIDGDKQYLNMLWGGGEGPIDGIKNITIEGNPIANYKDVQVDIRLGTNDQEPIANFANQWADKDLGYELVTGGTYSVDQTEGDAGQGLEVTFELPSLYHLNDNGSLGNASVTIKAQYRKVGDTTWIDWSTWTIIAAKNTTVYQVYRLDKLPAAKYEVQCTCTAKSGTSSRDATRVYWSRLTAITYDDLCRPNKVLVGIQALATDQLSSSDPTIEWEQWRNNVNVWNPNTLTYEQKRATNPFWACYDLIHNCKYLMNINTAKYEYLVEGNPVKRIDYTAFKENADYSDELNSDGEYRFILNYFLDENISFWDALARIAKAGRGVIIPKGTKYSCICDKPTESTQLFTMGNITQNSLKGNFQSAKDRALAIEVDFWNAKKDYKQDQAVYYDTEWESTNNLANPTAVTYYGIDDYKRAYKEAAYLYRCNKYLKRTENWSADVDAIACQTGDVVDLQHDIPRWGDAGGRIISATTNTVTLDKPADQIVLKPGVTYMIDIRLKTDVRVKRYVQAVSVETATNILTLTEAFDTMPEKYDIYAFGEVVKVTKPFRITSIGKAKDQKCKLVGVEYVEAVYDETLNMPVIQYSDFSVSSLVVKIVEILPRPSDGTAKLSVDWIWPRDSRVAKAIIYAGAFAASAKQMKIVPLGSLSGQPIAVNASGSWYVRVDITDVFGTLIATGNTTYTIATIVSDQVSNIRFKDLYRTTGNDTIINEVLVSWTPPDSALYTTAAVYVRAVEMLSSEVTPDMYSTVCSELGRTYGTWKKYGADINQLSVAGLEMGKTYQIRVVAQYKSDITADFDTAPYKEYTLTATTYPPSPPQGLTVSITTQCEWDITPSATSNVDFYELRTDQNYGQETGKLWAGNTLKIIKTPPTRNGRAYLYAHNTKGYSDPIWIDWNKEAPAAPANVKIATIVHGFKVTCDALPIYDLGINVYVDGTAYNSTNNAYTFNSTGGIYDVQVAYVDLLGAGEKSAAQTATVNAYIDPALIEAESLSLAMMDTDIKSAVTKANAAAPQLSVDAVNTSLTDARTRLATAEGTISTQSAAITTLNTEITAKADKTTLDTLTGRVTTAEGTISAQATLISAKAAQTTVDTLANTVTNNKASVD